MLDADQVTRELSQPGGAAHAAILQRFATADRGRLREIIFQDPKARQDLEGILHPLIVAESLRRMTELATRTGKSHVVYEAALLVETGRYKDFEGLIVIESPEASRKQRLMQRDHSDASLAEKIITSQISDEKRREAATVVIENTGTFDDLRQKVESFIDSRGWR